MREVFLVCTVVVGLMGFVSGSFGKEEPRTNAPVERTIQGQRVLYPQDWPIEEREGLVKPVPVEQYLGQRFDVVDQSLQAMTKRLEALEQRLKALDEGMKDVQSRLDAIEKGPATKKPR